MTEKKLTPKQRLFIAEYLIDKNGTQAAIRAGYSAKTAQAIATENLSKPLIKAEIDSALQERIEKLKVDADWIHIHLSELLNADIADIMEEDGSYRPIPQWPKIWRQMLAGCDVEELFDGYGKDRKKIGEVVKVKWSDRIKAIEVLGKLAAVNAFAAEKHIHSGKVSIESLIAGAGKAE